VENLDSLHKYAEELERRMRLQTFPLAVKMIEKESNIPDEARRPFKDTGHHLAACQGFASSRREGLTVAMTKEDMFCPEAVVGLGLEETPDFFFEGWQRYPHSVRTLEAGKTWAREFPRLEPAKQIGILSAPLRTIKFEPDVILIYCDSAQLTLFLAGAVYKEGHTLTCQVSSKAACVYAVVPPMQTGNFQVSIPCPGDRRYAGAQHDEIIFSLPTSKLEELISALRRLEGYNQLPYHSIARPDIEQNESYVKLGKLMGMDWLKVRKS
jgi:uncharacterized protein (DUF169 family)